MENHNRPSGGGGGGRSNQSRNRKSKNKRSRKRDNSRRNSNAKGGGNNNSNNRKKGPPSPPQTKVVIRNIGDVNKFGSVKEVMELIRFVIDAANQKLAAAATGASRIIHLDEASVDYLIQEEDAMLKAEVEASVKKESSNGQEEDAPTGEHDNENATTNDEISDDANPGNKVEPPADQPTYKETVVKSEEEEQNTPPPVPEASTTNLGARVVYIVPPKQTRRRGIKPGCAYLVISGPRIEAKEPVVVPIVPSDPVPVPCDPAKEEKKESNDDGEKEPTKDNEKETKDDDQQQQTQESPATPEPTADVTAAPADGENHVVIVEPTSTPNEPQAPPVPIVDYSREIANGRFLVLQAIDLMEAHVKDDTKSDQKYAGSVVEVAMSGKTYKHQFHRRDRREGTLETSVDYKTFMENTAKAKEELLARPKPAPGGGLSQAISTASTDALDHGQPIAALVEHIRSKRAEASKRKKAKKKAKDISNKEKGGGKLSRKQKRKEGTIKEEGGKKGGRKKDGKKRKRRDKKKNVKGGANSAILPAAPTAVLKPGEATAGLGAPRPIAPQAQQPTASLPGINGGMGGFQGYG